MGTGAREAPSWRAHLRAMLVAVHVVVVVLSAVPSPEGGMDRRAWDEPAVKVELAAWASRVGMEPRDFTARLWTLATRYDAALDVVLAPVRRYERWTGTAQNWKMFIAPHRFPARLRIEGRGALPAPWEVLYEARSDTATWMRATLDTERLRASIFRWSWPKYRATYRDGCKALAARVFAERADLVTVRCSLGRARTLSPEEARAGEVLDVTWGSPMELDR